MNQLARIDAVGHTSSNGIPLSLQASWPGMLADLSFVTSAITLVAMPTASVPKIQTDGSWTMLSGSAGQNGRFCLFVPGKTACKILELADPTIKFEKLLGADASLILEHVFSNGLVAIEETLDVELTFDQLGDVVKAPLEGLLGLQVDLEGERHDAALFIEGDLHDRLEYFTAERFDPLERDLDPLLEVHLGPVVLPAARALSAKPGETIDCGVSPSDTVRGVLMRRDGRYWPVFIEDDCVEIVGDLLGPVQISDGLEHVFATFVLAKVRLNAVERQQLVIGARIAVERLPDDGVELHYQASPYGMGSLTVFSGNLGVTINRVGPVHV